MERINIKVKVLVISEKGERSGWGGRVPGCLIFSFLTRVLDKQMFILLFSGYFFYDCYCGLIHVNLGSSCAVLSHPGISKPCLLSFPSPCPSSSFLGFHIVNQLCNALLPSLPTYMLGALHSQWLLWMTALILSITAQRSL